VGDFRPAASLPLCQNTIVRSLVRMSDRRRVYDSILEPDPVAHLAGQGRILDGPVEGSRRGYAVRVLGISLRLNNARVVTKSGSRTALISLAVIKAKRT
jgi:hypothetical protein